MGLDKVKYDAFISYRHCELDKFNAMTIQKRLENFRLPKSMYGKTTDGKTKIERVFRDQDELPLASNLSDPIEDALENSEFLIVICTPRLPESKWCAKEIDTFIALHDREHVLAVLAEGEPDESFPETLKYKTVNTVDARGISHEEKIEIEPLAADTRGSSKREISKKIDDAVLRIAAPIFGLNYDDLKQRHKEQRTKRLLSIAGSIAAVFFIFAMVCMFLAIRISSQKDTIEEQYAEIETKNREIEANNKEITAKNEEITAQNEEITAKNEEITAQNEEISRQYRAEQIKYAETMADASKELIADGRKKDALYAIRNSMSSTMEDDEKPYSAAAHRVLIDILGYYNANSVFYPGDIFETTAAPREMLFSPDGKNMLVIDNVNTLYVFDTETLEKKYEATSVAVDESPQWLSEDSFIYMISHKLYRYDVGNSEPVLISDDITAVLADAENGRYYTFGYSTEKDANYVCCYSSDTDNKRLFATKVNRKEENPHDWNGKMIISNESCSLITVFAQKWNSFFNDEKQDWIITVLDTENHETVLEQKMSFPAMEDAVMNDTNVFILIDILDEVNMVYDKSSVYSLDIATGDIAWGMEYDGIYFRDMTYMDTTKPELVLDASNVFYRVNISDGKAISSSAYDGQLVYTVDSVDSDSYMRTMLLRDGSIYAYDSATDQLYDFTNRYIKHRSSMRVVGAEFSKQVFYYVYENENYITTYRVPDNENVTASLKLKDAGISGDYIQYRKDYRYAVVTNGLKEDGSLFANEYEHILFDLITGEQLASVTDANYSVVFLPERDDEFATYSNVIKVYGYDGELLKQYEYENLDKFPTLSTDEAVLIYRVTASSDNVLVSLRTFDTVSELKDNDIGNRIYASEAAARYVLVKADGMEFYDFGSPEPYNKWDIDTSYFASVALSDDGKYLFISMGNNTLNIYSMDDLSLVNSIFSMNSCITGVSYIDELGAYFMEMANHYNLLLNENLEIICDITNCEGYDPADGCFTMIDLSTTFRIPYLSYEEMIRRADEVLGDYTPSDYIASKYHM